MSHPERADSLNDELRPATQASALSRLPGRADFVEYPASWYLFGPSRELRIGPVSRSILGRDLVAYRTEDGRVVVLDARCSHLGADLGKGRVVGNCIQCPFHSWRYGPDGRCRRIPQTERIPDTAKQRAYPAVERHGMVFVFNGPAPLFPLPFFFNEEVDHFISARPVEFVAECTWFMVAAHGYDAQHFESVHSRRLHGPMVVDCPAVFARRSRYTADVLGDAYYDRLLRRFAGRTVEISITTWGGTIVTITGRFKRATSRFMIALRPLEGGRTLCQVVAFAPRARHALARVLIQPLSLWVRRLFTGGYLLAETRSLGGPRYNPHSLIEGDREMSEYFRWAATLPSSAHDG